MFFVFNKEKIYSYLVVASTVMVLFFTASILHNEKFESIQTSSNMVKKLPIYSVQTDENKVALTMNCAWNSDDIDKILETLKKCNIKITFFMVGDWVEKYPDAVKKINGAGHEIANHSDSHPHVKNLSYEKNVEQILACSKKIEKITGKKTFLYRGPYGEYNDTVIKAAKDNGHTVIQWSIDTLDYNGLDKEQMWDKIKNKLTKGSIILMHNGTEHTADSLEYIINNIKTRKYEIVPVSKLIYTDEYYIDSNGVQKAEY